MAFVAVCGGISIRFFTGCTVRQIRDGHIHAIDIEAPRHTSVFIAFRNLIGIARSSQSELHFTAVHLDGKRGLLTNARQAPVPGIRSDVPIDSDTEAVDISALGGSRIRIVIRYIGQHRHLVLHHVFDGFRAEYQRKLIVPVLHRIYREFSRNLIGRRQIFFAELIQKRIIVMRAFMRQRTVRILLPPSGDRCARSVAVRQLHRCIFDQMARVAVFGLIGFDGIRIGSGSAEAHDDLRTQEHSHRRQNSQNRLASSFHFVHSSFKLYFYDLNTTAAAFIRTE